MQKLNYGTYIILQYSLLFQMQTSTTTLKLPLQSLLLIRSNTPFMSADFEK